MHLLRWLVTGVFLLLPPHAWGGPAKAAPRTAPALTAADAACIELEVNGERIPDYACMSERLAPASRKPMPEMPASEQQVRLAPTALGLAHRAATQQRMGNSFGIFTRPQRPLAPPPAPPTTRP